MHVCLGLFGFQLRQKIADLTDDRMQVRYFTHSTVVIVNELNLYFSDSRVFVSLCYCLETSVIAHTHTHKRFTVVVLVVVVVVVTV